MLKYIMIIMLYTYNNFVLARCKNTILNKGKLFDEYKLSDDIGCPIKFKSIKL